jgi:methyl-accepting chemotaxis protein
LTQMIQLTERLDFFGVDEAAKKNLISLKPVIQSALPVALDHFYNRIAAHPHTLAFFPDRNTIPGLAARQAKHWTNIINAQFDEKYLMQGAAVGRTHAAKGLEPRWYIGGYALILEQLIAEAIEARWPKRLFTARGVTSKQVASELGALVKAALLDMDVAISVYLEELAAARDAAERERLKGEEAQRLILDLVGERLSLLAQGDLTTRLEASVDAQHEALKAHFNLALDELDTAMSSIGLAAHGLHGLAQEIAVASDDLSGRTEKQAASLEETASALNHITEAVTQNAAGAKEVASIPRHSK